jgi:CHAT domain-containing protein
VTIVEYSLTKERLLTWVLRHGTIDVSERRIEIGTLEQDIAAWLRALREADEARLSPAAIALYQLLIPPIVSLLPPDSQVIFVPDKILNAIPFAALRNPLSGRYMIEERWVSVVPSVTFYLALLGGLRTTDDRRAWSSLLVANPSFDRQLFPQLADLPGAAAETEAAQRSYGNSVILVGPAATHARLLAELDRHEILSFAGHAVDNPRDPAGSYLVLSASGGRQEPGILFGREIATIHLRRLRLVILSACHTAAASSQRIAGLAGLAGAFLDAGAVAVLGTLWEADDQAASRLLQEFHRRFGGGLDSAAALRAAQLALLHGNEPSLRSPGRWAAFEAIGEVH